jgi:hypothetical protein
VLAEYFVIFRRISVNRDWLTIKMNKFTSVVSYADEVLFEI